MVPRDAHSISRKSISENALKVLYRLNKAGYEAYLVGGSVRDILLNLSPKDFDVATNATPEQIKKLFRNCRLIGRRFRLAHIIFGKEIIEVATFRGPQSQNEDDVSVVKASHGMLLRDNVYGTIEEDAIRRDFTINSLYYSVADFSIRDYTNGLADLNNKIVKLVGDPDTRYREDPVRMLRAIRFCAKLDMTMDSQTAQPIPHLAHLLTHVPAARLFDESLKLLQTGHGYKTYQLLKEYGLFEFLFPIIARHFTQNQDSHLENIVEQVLKNTDYRLSQNKRINPAFLFAAMLWYPVTELAQKLSQEGGLRYSEAFALAISDILSEQNKTISIPKRFSLIISDIWYLQLRLNKLIGKRPLKILEHPKFRAAFDLLELRSNIEKGETLKLVRWWDNFQHVSPTEQLDILNNPECKLSTPKKRRSRPKATKKNDGEAKT